MKITKMKNKSVKANKSYKSILKTNPQTKNP